VLQKPLVIGLKEGVRVWQKSSTNSLSRGKKTLSCWQLVNLKNGCGGWEPIWIVRRAIKENESKGPEESQRPSTKRARTVPEKRCCTTISGSHQLALRPLAGLLGGIQYGMKKKGGVQSYLG